MNKNHLNNFLTHMLHMLEGENVNPTKKKTQIRTFEKKVHI